MSSRKKMVTTAFCVLALGLLGFAGCGGDDDGETTAAEEQTPEEVVTAFHAATQEGDATSVCELLTEESGAMGAEVEDTDDCQSAFEASFEETSGEVPDIEIGETTIDGNTATVVSTSNGSETELTLSKEDGRWKIDLLALQGAN